MEAIFKVGNRIRVPHTSGEEEIRKMEAILCHNHSVGEKARHKLDNAIKEE